MDYIEYKINRAGYDRDDPLGGIVRPNGSGDFDLVLFRCPILIKIDGEYKLFGNGTCIIYSPDHPQDYHIPAGTKLVHDWMHFMPYDLERFSSFRIPLNTPFSITDAHKLSSLIREVEYEHYNHKKDSLLFTSLQVTSMMLLITREIEHYASDKTRYTANLEREFTRFRMHLHNRCNEPWSVQKMAEELQLSRSRFTVLYSAFFGVSPINDLIDMRIDYAKQLLIRSDCSETEIAERCGYTDIFHFIRQFKQKTGLTPSRYRTLK